MEETYKPSEFEKHIVRLFTNKIEDIVTDHVDKNIEKLASDIGVKSLGEIVKADNRLEDVLKNTYWDSYKRLKNYLLKKEFEKIAKAAISILFKNIETLSSLEKKVEDQSLQINILSEQNKELEKQINLVYEMASKPAPKPTRRKASQ